MKSMIRWVTVLTAVCLVAALGLSQVHLLTEGPIAEAKRQETLAALRAVLPSFDNSPDQRMVEVDDRNYYVATNKGEIVGVAFATVTEQGYSGRIESLVGVDPSGRVTGVAVLAHAETPGLGAKFTDPGFLAQYKGHTLDDSKWKVKKDGGDFDQITGATITPRALTAAIEEGLKGFRTDTETVLTAPAPQPTPAAEGGKE